MEPLSADDWNVDDVVLMGCLMMRSVSVNPLYTPRIVITPSVYMKELFQFDRADPGVLTGRAKDAQRPWRRLSSGQADY